MGEGGGRRVFWLKHKVGELNIERNSTQHLQFRGGGRADTRCRLFAKQELTGIGGDDLPGVGRSWRVLEYPMGRGLSGDI